MEQKIDQLKDLVISLIEDVHRMEVESAIEYGSSEDYADMNKQENLKYLENILSGSASE